MHLAFYGKSPKFSLGHAQYLTSYGKSKIQSVTNHLQQLLLLVTFATNRHFKTTEVILNETLDMDIAQVRLQILLHRRKKQQVSRVTFCQAESKILIKD